VRATVINLLLLLPQAFAAASHSEVSAQVTPLQKLIEMLDGMLAKGGKEKHEEEVEFAKYQVWCDDVRNDKIKSIKEGAEQIEQLTADIAKAQSDAEILTKEIAELDKTIAEDEAELKGASDVREKEEAEYLTQHKDFSESIDACGRAIQVLGARTADVPQSLLQLQNTKMIPRRAKVMIESFLAMRSDASEEAGQPEANAYEFQSGSVISMLEKLKADFSAQLLALEKEEMNSKANYEVLAQTLTDNIAYAKKSVAKKTATKAARLESAASDKGDKETAITVKADDEKTLADNNAACDAQSREFENNQVTRAEEIKAIQKAREILTSDAVKGNAETYLPSASMAQTSLAQLRSTINSDEKVRQKVIAFLQGRAAKFGSRYLSMVAARAAEDPFLKVKKMIKDLIVRLMEEANSEADQHAYCETEMATNKQTRENKASEVEELTSEIDGLTALSSELSSEIAELAEDMAALQEKRAEATKVRQEEKATNTKTIADAKEGQTAVELATKVLKEFYGNVGGSASMLQENLGQSLQAQMSEEIKAPYKGMMATSGGIFGMLEVVLSDFARLEAETSTAEDQAVAEYEKFMNESSESLALKETEKKHKEEKKERTDQTVTDLTKERELTQGELDAALKYYDKLKADCVDKGLSYEERVRAREEEVQSLQEALKILEGEDLAA